MMRKKEMMIIIIGLIVLEESAWVYEMHGRIQ